MIKAVAYIRVSTEGQVDKYGLESQAEAIRVYAKQNDLEIVEWFREEGVSGKNDLEHRIALADLKEHLATNADVTTVIIPELSRLARDLMIQETILGDFKKNGWTIISVKEPDLCSDDPTRKLVRQMMGAINEYDRAMIVARMKAGRIAKARKGEHAAGRIPLGYTSVTVDGRKTLVKNDAEAEIVRLVFKLRAERNLSYQKIADYLNENGYKPKNWTAEAPTKFHKSTVQKILNNTKYSGTVTLNEHGETVAEGKNDSLRLL